MIYMGSKRRYAKDILPIILKNRKEGQWYVEPFAGGFNMIDKVSGNRIANDINEYVVAVFQAMQNGWKPPTEITEHQYKHIRDNKHQYPKELVGFVGICCSYSGKFFDGFARNKSGRNYAIEGYNSLMKQLPNITGIKIHGMDYRKLHIPQESIIYCDPPYESTTSYRTSFDHKVFWNWARLQHYLGHEVFVSEYNAPDDFKCVWSKEVYNDLNTKGGGGKRGVEKLFSKPHERTTII